MTLDFVTLFPEVIDAYWGRGVLGRARERGAIGIRTRNPRDYCYDRHRKVDDTPYGGEPGMLLKAEPVALAIESLGLPTGAAIIAPDPAAPIFRQSDAVELAGRPHIVFICGHYEGIDDRVLARFCTHRFSVGEYIVTGGELPALMIADAIARNLESVLGNEGSLTADSYGNGFLSAPNYTRPPVWRGEAVPAVLTNGDHAAIARYRKAESLRLTRLYRPDLLGEDDATSERAH